MHKNAIDNVLRKCNLTKAARAQPTVIHRIVVISSNVVMFCCRSDAEINTFLSGKIGPTVTILFYCITFSFKLHLFGMYFIEPYYIYLDCMYYNSFHRIPQRCVSRALVSQSDTLIAQCAKA